MHSLTDVISVYEVHFTSNAMGSYALVYPKEIWSTPICFNVPSLCWNDDLSFYLVFKVQHDTRNIVSSDFERLLKNLPPAAIAKNEEFLLYGFTGSKKDFDAIDTDILTRLPFPAIKLQSYYLLKNRPPPILLKAIEAEWTISLPNEQNPNKDQIYQLSDFRCFHNLVRFCDGVFRLFGVKNSFKSMFQYRTQLSQQLGTEAKLLLFCNDFCQEYREVKKDSRIKGYRCKTCGGACSYKVNS